MLSTKGLVIALAIAGTSFATVAAAHPRLASANPAPNSVMRGSPRVIRATFSEALIASFSGIEVRSASGAAMPVGKATVDPRDRRTLVATVNRPLAPGGYVVRWHAVSADTHRLQGVYSFRVR